MAHLYDDTEEELPCKSEHVFIPDGEESENEEFQHPIVLQKTVKKKNKIPLGPHIQPLGTSTPYKAGWETDDGEEQVKISSAEKFILLLR